MALDDDPELCTITSASSWVQVWASNLWAKVSFCSPSSLIWECDDDDDDDDDDDVGGDNNDDDNADNDYNAEDASYCLL